MADPPSPAGPSSSPGPATASPSLTSIVVAELVGTAVLLFISVAVVWSLNAPDAVVPLGSQHQLAHLVIAGVTSGAVITGVIISRIGAISGGHVNPAVTLGMWALGSTPAAHVPAYLLGQFLGSGAGVVAARMLLGETVGDDAVNFAAINPPGPVLVALLAEGAALIVIMTVIVLTANWMPRPVFGVVMGAVVAGLIVLTGPWAGGSFNPARQVWPYILAGVHPVLVMYVAAPVVGAVAAAWGWRQRPSGHTKPRRALPPPLNPRSGSDRGRRRRAGCRAPAWPRRCSTCSGNEHAGTQSTSGAERP